MARRGDRSNDPCCYGHRSPRWVEEANASSMQEMERARNAMVVR